MTDVADFINESKKRKDIVEKYKQAEGQTLTRKISKLNMHSINKKSSRMSQKLLSTIGIDPMVRDTHKVHLDGHSTASHLLLDRQEIMTLMSWRDVSTFFPGHASCLQWIVRGTVLIGWLKSKTICKFSIFSRFRECLHECALAQFNISENVADFYGDEKSRSIREVDRFRNAHRTIISTYWNQYVMNYRVTLGRGKDTLTSSICILTEHDSGIEDCQAFATAIGCVSRPSEADPEAKRQAPRLLGQHAKVGEKSRSNASQSGTINSRLWPLSQTELEMIAVSRRDGPEQGDL